MSLRLTGPLLALVLAAISACAGGGTVGYSASDSRPDTLADADAADAEDAADAADAEGATDLPDADAADTEGTTDIPDADATDVADADAPEVEVPEPPVLQMVFKTATGDKGLDVDTVDLVLADEPSAYTTTPGFQMDITVTTQHLEDGADVRLSVAGSLVATVKAVVDAGTGLGTATFLAVILTHNPTGYEIKAEATNGQNLDGLVLKTVKVDIGTCGVALTPTNQLCLLADADPATPGLQVNFIVSNPDRTCTTATVTVTADGVTTTSPPAALDAGGAATIPVTVLDRTDGVDGVTVQISAEVSDQASAARTAGTNPLDYVLDLVDPVVTVTSPEKTVLGLLEDKDRDLSNGLDFDTAGTAVGTRPGSPLDVTLGGEPAGAPVPDANGLWQVKDLSVSENLVYTVVAVGHDTCGRTGRGERSFQAAVTQATLSILSPAAGAVLLAKDDGNPATTQIYETSLGVQGDQVLAGTTLTALCRENRPSMTEIAVGSLTVDTPAANGVYAIPVALPTTLTSRVSCRVVDNAANPSESGRVAFVVALPAPQLLIQKPIVGARIIRSPLAVSLGASNLNGIVPAVRILDADGVETLSFTPPGAIQNNGLSFAVPLLVGGQPLADGEWTLDVQASDAFGNQASDNPASRTQVAFSLDTVAPSVSITTPAADTLDPATNPADADQEPAVPGYQTTVVVTVAAGGGTGTRVCLTTNGDRDCQTLADGQSEATFAAVTLVAGPNDLSAQATDPGGNVGTAARTITLVLASPRVRITLPDRNGPVSALPFNLTVKVTNAALQDQAGAPVSVSVNGVDNTFTGTTDASGNATFLVEALSTTGDTFVARSTVGGMEGVSAPRTLFLKETQPLLSFRTPKDQDLISSTFAACEPGRTECVLDVQLDAQNLEDGSAGQLTVTCQASIVAYDGFVNAGVLTFPDVTLLDQGTCSLAATATDLAGQIATASISVRVDRVGPRVVTFSNPDPNVGALTFTSDENGSVDGMQLTFKVVVSGLEAGRTITVSYGLLGGTPNDVTALLDVATPNNTTREVVLPQVTLQSGVYQVVASVEDEAGNTAELARILTVFVDQPIVRLIAPAFVDHSACTSAAECGAGAVCVEGFCATPWSVSTPRTVIVSVLDLPPGTDNLRLCDNRAGLTGTPCSTAGYRQVALGSSAGSGNTTFTLNGLPDGSHEFIAEGLLAAGQPWVSSSTGPNAIERNRYIFQDTIVPVVTTLTSPGDTQPPTGVLNIAEQAAPDRVYTILVESSEPGAMTLVLNGLDGPARTDFAGTVVVEATLREGGNELYARISDRVGNLSVLPPLDSVLYYRPTVDTTPPTLAFQNPAGPLIKAGDSRDIVVVSDAVGRTLTLLDGGVEKGTATVDVNGTATFAFATLPILTDGDHTLEARVTDDAGNLATLSTAVIVATVPPEVQLESPANNAVLTDADDASPGSPGFQLEISFGSPSSGASSWQVQLAMNCDPDFVACDPPDRIAQGSITNAGGLEPSIFETLPVGTTPFYKVIVVIVDTVGNTNSASANITVNLAECQVALGGIGSGAYINNQLCPTPGADCASTTLTVTVTISASCGAVDTVRLFQSDVDTQEKPLSGQTVSFTTTVSDGSSATFEARVYEGGARTGSSGSFSRTVDLLDPVVAFTYPVAGSTNNWGYLNDGLPATPGLQRTLTILTSDVNLAGGEVTSLRYAGQPVAPTNLTVPYGLAASPATVNFSVTLPDQSSGAADVTVTDLAGNSATSSFSATIDLQPPASPTLEPVPTADINPRLPAVTLRWSAVGDNGTSGGPATSYDIRYSPLPILNQADFDRACRVSGLAYTAAVPTPAAPGTAEVFTVTGPDIRNPTVNQNGTPCLFIGGTNPSATNYAFAIRAIDDVGNASPIAPIGVAEADLSLRYAQLTGTVAPYSDSLFNKRVSSIGDLDNDGLGDVAIGGGGGTTQNTFCVVYGNGAGDARTVSDLAISSPTGADHQCLAGAADALFGVPVAEAGDMNADGAGDLVVGEGKLGAQTAKVWFGVQGGRLAANPNLTITGINTTLASVSVAGAGDFNGDGASDLLIASPGENVVYLLPGQSTWTAATSIAISLQSAPDRAAYGIVALTMTGGGASTRFGVRVAFVGDLDGDGKHEAAVATAAAPTSQVLVFKGRDVAAVPAITVAIGTGGPDDGTVIRLAADSTTAAANFGNSLISGGQDLDMDGSPDVVVTHTAAAALAGSKTIYMFRGGYLKTRFGETVQVLATTGIGTGIVQNEKGFLISGSFDKALPIGNFDNDADATPDIAYIIYSTGTSRGKVFVRRNVKDPAGTFGYGTFPYESPVLVDPLDPTGLRFGYFGAVPIGDFNGDGFPDLLVGTDGAGYAMILY